LDENEGLKNWLDENYKTFLEKSVMKKIRIRKRRRKPIGN